MSICDILHIRAWHGSACSSLTSRRSRRGGAPEPAAKTVHFAAKHAAEARWRSPRARPGPTGDAGPESAVLSVRVDGREATSIVLFGGRNC